MKHRHFFAIFFILSLQVTAFAGVSMGSLYSSLDPTQRVLVDEELEFHGIGRDLFNSFELNGGDEKLSLTGKGTPSQILYMSLRFGGLYMASIGLTYKNLNKRILVDLEYGNTFDLNSLQEDESFRSYFSGVGLGAGYLPLKNNNLFVGARTHVIVIPYHVVDLDEKDVLLTAGPEIGFSKSKKKVGFNFRVGMQFLKSPSAGHLSYTYDVSAGVSIRLTGRKWK